jgi:prevent-host-death family protein
MDITIADAHNHLSALLQELAKGPVTITRHGKPAGVLISPEEYENFVQMQAYIRMLNLSKELKESIPAREIYKTSRSELDERA